MPGMAQWTPALPEKTMNDLPPRPAADIGAVEDRFFTLRNFPLTDGTVMPEATIAYETYGRPAPDGRNAILCTHGYTGSHHFAGRNPANGNQPGSWNGLIGPGKAIDTDKLFVVASNMLGSSFGSTNAGNINPQTGEAYGPDFPNMTIRDIVAAQKALLDHLGVRHLVAVAGPLMAATRRSNGRSPTPTSWTRSCRSTRHPGPRSTPTSNWPNCRRGLPAIPNGMTAAITARRRARRC
jgi:homoserine acetyltransferase